MLPELLFFSFENFFGLFCGQFFDAFACLVQCSGFGKIPVILLGLFIEVWTFVIFVFDNVVIFAVPENLIVFTGDDRFAFSVQYAVFSVFEEQDVASGIKGYLFIFTGNRRLFFSEVEAFDVAGG